MGQPTASGARHQPVGTDRRQAGAVARRPGARARGPIGLRRFWGPVPMTAASGWAVLSPLPFTPEHVAGLVASEARDTLTNYRTAWYTLASCGINPDWPYDRFRLAAASQDMAREFPTPEHRSFALHV